MVELTPAKLARAFCVSQAAISPWIAPLALAMERFHIDTPTRQMMFLAQTGHESRHFLRTEENLNYSAKRLREVFRKYFTTDASAAAYAGQPARIANRVYANRMGNGPESSGEGWRYRGRGLIQLTGADNYRAAGDSLGLPLLAEPDRVAEHAAAALTAAWYWTTRGCNGLADANDFYAVTRRINGGTLGIDERLALWHTLNEVFTS